MATNNDLMNTQTGGEGETVQIQTQEKITPEQFDVNIKAQETPIDSEPPVQPPVQREMTEQEVVGAGPSEFVEAQETFTEEPPALPEAQQAIAPSVIVDEDPNFYPYIPEETVEEESPFYPFETEAETVKKSFQNTKDQIDQDLTNTGLKPVIDMYNENEDKKVGFFGKVKGLFKKDEKKQPEESYNGVSFTVEKGDEVDEVELSKLGFDTKILEKPTIDPAKRLDEQEITEEEDLTDIIDKKSIIGQANELFAREQATRDKIKTARGESLKSLKSELKSIRKTLNDLKKSGEYKEEKDIYKQKALAKGALDPYYYNPKGSVSGVIPEKERRTPSNFVVKNPLGKDVSSSIFSNKIKDGMNQEEANTLLYRLFVSPSDKAYWDNDSAAKVRDVVRGGDGRGNLVNTAMTYEEVMAIDKTFRNIANWAQQNGGISVEGKNEGKFKAALFPAFGFLPETTVEVKDRSGRVRKVTLFSDIYENPSHNELVKNGYGVVNPLDNKDFIIPDTKKAYFVPEAMIKGWEKQYGSDGFRASTFKQQQRLARLKDANGQPYLQSDRGMFGAGVTGYMDQETYDAQKRLDADIKNERNKANKKGIAKGEVTVKEEGRFGERNISDYNPIEEWRTKNVKGDFSYGKYKLKDIPLENMRNTADAMAWAKSHLPEAKKMEFSNPNIFEQDQEDFKKYIDGLGFKGISVKPLGGWLKADFDYVRLDGKGKSLIIDLNEGSDDLNNQQLKRLTDWVKVSQDDPQSDFIKDFTSVFDKDYAVSKLVKEKTSLGEEFTVSFENQAGNKINITNKNGQLEAQQYFNELEFQQAYYSEIREGLQDNVKNYNAEIQPYIEKFNKIQQESDKSIIDLEKQIAELELRNNNNQIESDDFSSQFQELQNKVLAVNENLMNSYKELQSSLGNNKPLLDQINKDYNDIQTANSKLKIIAEETEDLAGIEMARLMADNAGPRTVLGNVTAAISSGFMKPFIASVSAASDLLIQAGIYPEDMTKDEAIKQNNEWKTEFLYGELSEAMEKSFGTYMSPGYQERLSMPGEAIYGAIESVGTQANPLVALLSKTPLAPVASMMGYASQSYTQIEEEILKSPDLKDIPEYQKKLISIPYAIGLAAIDKYAYGKIAAGKSSVAQRMLVEVVNKALEKLPKNATLETIEAVIKGDVKSNIAKFGLALNRAGVTELGAEGFEAAAFDVGLKELWDHVLDKDAFNTGDVFEDYVETIVKSSASGYIGGLALGGAGRTVEFLGTGNINMINPEDYNFFKVVADDPQLKNLYASSVANKFGRGEIDKTQAEKMMLDFENLIALDKKVLDDITGEDRLEMVKLLFEKQKIQERIKELDESQQKLPNYKLEGVNKKIDEIVARTEERINKQQEYDQKDEQRVSSEVGEGQESIETQPVTETSQEEVSPGGMVQEEQTELEQVRQRINEIDSAASRGEILENSEPGELRELKRREKELSSKLEESIPTEPQNNDSEKTTEEVREVKLNENLPKIEVEGEVVQETTITNEFDELADINKITSPAKKNKAMKAFNEKYGEKAARISQIDSKFTSIVSKLERNKIITKKC